MGPQRLKGLTGSAGLFARVVFWFTRRRLGREWEPLRVAAHNPAVLQAVVGFEAGWQRASRLSTSLRALVTLKTSALVGCPA